MIVPGITIRRMTASSRNKFTPLTLIGDAATDSTSRVSSDVAGRRTSSVCESDWSTLMARAQNGDRDTYRRLLEEVTPYVRSLARKRLQASHDLEDVVQDVLLTVHSIRHTYDPNRPFGPWLVAIANRRIIDRLRRESRLRSLEVVLEVEHETFPAPQANLYEAALDVRTLNAAVELLPTTQRQAIRLVKLRELSLKEAAIESGLSVASLKVASHRALKSLRRILKSRD